MPRISIEALVNPCRMIIARPIFNSLPKSFLCICIFDLSQNRMQSPTIQCANCQRRIIESAVVRLLNLGESARRRSYSTKSDSVYTDVIYTLEYMLYG